MPAKVIRKANVCNCNFVIKKGKSSSIGIRYKNRFIACIRFYDESVSHALEGNNTKPYLIKLEGEYSFLLIMNLERNFDTICFIVLVGIVQVTFYTKSLNEIIHNGRKYLVM